MKRVQDKTWHLLFARRVTLILAICPHTPQQLQAAGKKYGLYDLNP
jgi:hypothetical protein